MCDVVGVWAISGFQARGVCYDGCYPTFHTQISGYLSIAEILPAEGGNGAVVADELHSGVDTS